MNDRAIGRAGFLGILGAGAAWAAVVVPERGELDGGDRTGVLDDAQETYGRINNGPHHMSPITVGVGFGSLRVCHRCSWA